MLEERRKRIKDLFLKLNSELSALDKKKIHFKSIRNFTFHLVENQKYKKGGNKELQQLGEERMVVLLLEYLETIDDSRLEKIPDYKEYVQKIGAFMMKYYGFSYSGGKIIFFKLLLSITLGMVLDLIVFLFVHKFFYLFTIVSILRFTIVTALKYRDKKVFGYFY